MGFALSEEQSELAATVRSLLAKRSDSQAVRAALTSPEGFDTGLWRLLCEQVGVAALAVPEEYDGAGASLFETGLVLEELGRTLTPSPLLATAVATEALLAAGDDAACADVLPRVAAGEVATLGVSPDVLRRGCPDSPFAGRPDGDTWRLSGEASGVLDASAAAVFVVPAVTADGLALFLVEATSATVDRQVTMDPTTRLGSLRLADAPARRIDADAAAVLERAALALQAGIVMLELGCAQRGLDMTVAYSKERVQFGRPIGSFQALKHRMADLLVLVETSRSAAWAAAHAVATHAPDSAHLAAVAASYCGDAVTHVASETIQLHGGIAITWEHDAHLVFKRAHALTHLAGQPHEHRAALVR